jgi:hypothetical protein
MSTKDQVSDDVTDVSVAWARAGVSVARPR